MNRTVCAIAMLTMLLLGVSATGQKKANPEQAGDQSQENKKFALLIGIDKYQHVTPLHGAVQDVKDIQSVLTSKKFGFPASNVLTLTDERATSDAIKSAFRSHLIVNAKKCHNAIIFFHYSGHGSQLRDEENGDELDGYDETIVPIDSCHDECPNTDITDDQLGELFEELTSYTSEVTAVFDSCHSGTVNRGEATAREAPRDERSLSIRKGSSARDGKPRDAQRTDFMASTDKYVMIAGCKPEQKSYEVTNGNRNNGALTFHLVRAMRRVGPRTSYRELMREVARAVSLDYSYQEPQVEGNITKPVLGGSANEEDYYVELTEVRDNQVTLAAGAAHGIKEGSIVAIYEPGTDRLAGEKGRLANATVLSVTTDKAIAELAGLPAGKKITTDARAKLISPLFGAEPKAVSLEATAAARREGYGQSIAAKTRNELMSLLAKSRLVAVKNLSRGSESTRGVPAFDLAVRSGKFGEVFKGRQIATRKMNEKELPNPVDDKEVYYIASKDGEPVFDFYAEPGDPKAAELIADAMEKWARQQNLLSLENQLSPLNSGIKVSVLRVYGSTNAQGRFVEEREEPISPDELERGLGLQVIFSIQVENQTDVPLYVHIFNVSTDGAIHIGYPPKSTLKEALRPRSKPIESGLFRTASPAGRETFKVIVTTSEKSDFAFLEQEGASRGETRQANDPLEALMSQALVGTRSKPVENIQRIDQWGTAQISFEVRK